MSYWRIIKTCKWNVVKLHQFGAVFRIEKLY